MRHRLSLATELNLGYNTRSPPLCQAFLQIFSDFFMPAAQFIDPQKAFRFSACTPHPPPLTLRHLPHIRGKAYRCGKPLPPLCKGRWVNEVNPEGLLTGRTTHRQPLSHLSVTAPLTQGSQESLQWSVRDKGTRGKRVICLCNEAKSPRRSAYAAGRFMPKAIHLCVSSDSFPWILL